MKSRNKERVAQVGTFGSATEFPALICIVDHINNKMDNGQRIKVLRFLDKVCKTLTLISKIQPTGFRIEIRKRYAKEFRERFKNDFADYDLSLRTHVDNFIHAKYSQREDAKIKIAEEKYKKLQLQKQSAIKDVPLPKFNIFGSKSSQDYDVLVFPNFMGSIAHNAQQCKKYEWVLENFFERHMMPKKKINVNLAFVNDGSIINVHKGTFDEVNNSLLKTYNNHTQFNPIQVKYEYTRTGDGNQYVELKVKRCLRFLISFFSRIEELRPYIKPAMKGNVDERLHALRKINLLRHKDFSGKKEKPEDIYKVIAFQLAQTHLLIQGIEIYSKEEAIHHCPEFTNALMRKPLTKEDLEVLQDSLEALIVNTVNLKPHFKSLDEPIFNS